MWCVLGNGLQKPWQAPLPKHYTPHFRHQLPVQSDKFSVWIHLANWQALISHFCAPHTKSIKTAAPLTTSGLQCSWIANKNTTGQFPTRSIVAPHLSKAPQPQAVAEEDEKIFSKSIIFLSIQMGCQKRINNLFHLLCTHLSENFVLTCEKHLIFWALLLTAAFPLIVLTISKKGQFDDWKLGRKMQMSSLSSSVVSIVLQ